MYVLTMIDLLGHAARHRHAGLRAHEVAWERGLIVILSLSLSLLLSLLLLSSLVVVVVVVLLLTYIYIYICIYIYIYMYICKCLPRRGSKPKLPETSAPPEVPSFVVFCLLLENVPGCACSDLPLLNLSLIAVGVAGDVEGRVPGHLFVIRVIVIIMSCTTYYYYHYV